MANTDRMTAITQKALAIYKTPPNPTTLGIGIPDMYFGDQNRIPRTPALCVDSGDYSRTLSGRGGKGRTDNIFTVFTMFYLCKVADIQATKLSVEQLAETAMDILHADVTFGGLVIHGFVTKIEPGYSMRQGVLFRTARMTWEGLTKTLIA